MLKPLKIIDKYVLPKQFNFDDYSLVVIQFQEN